MKQKIKIIILSGIFLLIDIIVKLLVANKLVLNESIKIIDNFFYITYVKNTGAAWSILSGRQTFLIIISLIIIFLLIAYLIRKKEYKKIEIIGYSMLISGSIGNLIDRIVYGYVIDYLNFYIFNYNYPIFNIADVCIVIGIILLVIDSWREENGVYNRRRKRKN